MARISGGKTKKTKGGATKATKLPAQPKGNVGALAEQNGSASNHVHEEEEPVEQVSLRESREHEGGKEEAVSNASRQEHVSQNINADGSNVSETDSAMHHRIAEHAFMLFQESGCQHGRDWADWFEAERHITQTDRSSRDD